MSSEPRRLRGRLVRAGILAAAIVASVGVAVPAGAAASCTPVHSGAVTFDYAGDSTTAKPESWMHQVNTAVVDPVGGYAHSGWTSGQVLARIVPAKADVLVIMLGINDLHFAATDHDSVVIANINRIAAKMRVAKVIISAVAPSDVNRWWQDGSDSRIQQTALNVDLKKDAAAHGWTYTDPWAAIRARDGSYVAGYTVDHIHPTPAGGAIVARAMTATIVSVAHSGECRG